MTRDPLDLGDEFDAFLPELQPEAGEEMTLQSAEEEDYNEEYLAQISSEESIKLAAKLGMRVVFPKPNELQVDIDGGAELDTFTKNIRIFRQFFGEATFDIKPSKSGEPNRFHAVVTTNRYLSNLERIAFQAVLGSDPKRELLSLVRELVIHDSAPTLFFEDDK